MITIDLNAIRKPITQVVFHDGRILNIFEPSKKLKDSFSTLGEKLIKVGNGTKTEEDLEVINEITAEIFSRNKEGIEITKEDVEKEFSQDEIIYILGVYAENLRGEIERKN